MKKIYKKPSLLSETFVTENIMTGVDLLSTMDTNLWTFTGTEFQGIQFNTDGGNTLYKVSFESFME